MAGEIQGRRCATIDVSTGDRARMMAMERDYLAQTRIAEADLTVVIPVHFIHITDGADGAITAAQRRDQIAALNKAYEKIGVVFTHTEDHVTSVDNASFFRMGHLSARERTCKTTHRAVDPTRGLN